MTIMSDVVAAMLAAPRKPIGIILGCSGWHAYHAIRAQADRDDEFTREVLRITSRLSISRTHQFSGFDLILDKGPNPYRGKRGRAAA